MSVGFNRRQFLVGTAAVVGAVGLSGGVSACSDEASTTGSGLATGTSGGGGATDVRLVLNWLTDVEWAGLWLAQDKGYMAEQQINPVVQAGGPNAPDPSVVVVAGKADIGISDLATTVQAVSKGNDLVIIGATYQKRPGCVISLASRPVREPKDLVGSRFLGQPSNQIYVNAVLKLAGLPQDYQFIPVGFSVDPLLKGQGDAYSGFITSQVVTLEQQGLKEGTDFFAVSWADLGLPAYAAIVFTTRQYLDSNRDTVVKFMHAMVKGWQLNETLDPQVAAQLVVDKYGTGLGLDLKQQTLENKLQVPYTQSDFTKKNGLFSMDPQLVSGDMYRGLTATGLTGLPDVSRLVDTTVMRDVYQGKLSLLT